MGPQDTQDSFIFNQQIKAFKQKKMKLDLLEQMQEKVDKAREAERTEREVDTIRNDQVCEKELEED